MLLCGLIITFHQEIVEMLLQDKRVEINQQDYWNGDAALMMVSKRGHKEVVQILEANDSKN